MSEKQEISGNSGCAQQLLIWPYIYIYIYIVIKRNHYTRTVSFIIMQISADRT